MYYRKHHHRHHRHHHWYSLRSRGSKKRLMNYTLILFICFTFAFTLNLITSKLRPDQTQFSSRIEKVNGSSATKLKVSDRDIAFFGKLINRHTTQKDTATRLSY